MSVDLGSADPMLVSAYAAFVVRTDMSAGYERRSDVALYGLVGEIGSVAAAVKKRLLVEGRADWNVPNDEIVEEIGDSLWYCFALAEASGLDARFLASDIRSLQAEIGSDTSRSRRLHEVLGASAGEFLELAQELLVRIGEGTAALEDYRRVAFLTLRTKGDEAVEVCLAVLQQLAAELLRSKLPPLERELNRMLPDRSVETVLGEIAWHLAALASLYGISLDEIARRNVAKLMRRFGRGEPTPLPDAAALEAERLPRHFEVAIVAVGSGRSRMYMGGHRLGDDLTDNAYAEDGYRFHDVMHLALAAMLGWSPVLRKLLGRKRRSEPRIDEVEDGARAVIVEEAVIKAIHAEGVRLAALAGRRAKVGSRLFADRSDISFAFLKRLQTLVAGLEVERNRLWEWEDAIVEGFRIFDRLRVSGRGTVRVDLEARTIELVDGVYANVAGVVAAFGTASIPLSSSDLGQDEASLFELALRKAAILCSLGLDDDAGSELNVRGWRGDLVDVTAVGATQQTIWDRKIVLFRVSTIREADRITAICLGIADPAKS